MPNYDLKHHLFSSQQVYKYADVPHPDGTFSTDENKKEITKVAELDEHGRPKQKTRLTEHERKMIDDMVVISRATNPEFARVRAEKILVFMYGVVFESSERYSISCILTGAFIRWWWWW